MKYECDMIADLLPLYKDGVCSAASERIVKEHLAECQKCSSIMEKLNDNYIDEEIIREKDNVINSQSKFFKRKSALAGSIVAGIFAVPILVCLIVNLATGSGLGWFFIVLAAMFIPTSLIVVPLMVPKNRMLLTMGAFTFSVLFLLGVISLYSKGNWFFIAASSVLFGLTICFAPFIVARRPVNKYLKKTKGLVLMGAYTLTFVLMMICIGLSINSPEFFGTAFAISLPILAVAWITFFIIRYLPVNGFMKAGICIALLSLFSYFAKDIIYTIMGVAQPALMDNSDVVVSNNPSIAGLVIAIVIGAIFFVIGIIMKLAGGRNNEAA